MTPRIFMYIFLPKERIRYFKIINYYGYRNRQDANSFSRVSLNYAVIISAVFVSFIL
jgi:hypothetical protein